MNNRLERGQEHLFIPSNTTDLPPVDRTISREILSPLSRDCVPIIFHEQNPTLLRILNNIVSQVSAQSRAIENGTLSYPEAKRLAVFFVGNPGSGKSFTMEKFDEALEAVGVHEEHINKFSWEEADSDHLQARSRERTASVISSHEELQEGNIRAYNQYKQNTNNWLLARGEFAPIVKRDLDTGMWNGRDAGATTIELILRDKNVNPFIIGMAGEWRIDEFLNPVRTQGAFPNQVLIYHAIAVQKAKQLLAEGGFEVPSFIKTFLTDSSLLQFKDLPNEIQKKSRESAKLLYAIEELELERNVQERFSSEMIERFRHSDGSLLSNSEKVAKLGDCRRKVGLRNAESLVPLYLMNYNYTKEVEVPETNIFMGMMSPQITDVHYDDSMTQYIRRYSTQDLANLDKLTDIK